jgi:hypothetical protein
VTPRQVDELTAEEYRAMTLFAIEEGREAQRAQRKAERKAR